MAGKQVSIDLASACVTSFATGDRVTLFLSESLSDEQWSAKVPGSKGKTIGGLVVHIHNVRCMWIKMLGKRARLNPPARLDRRTATREDALAALKASSRVIIQLLQFGLEQGGKVPGFPPDLAHFVCYMVAHEGHHRGQICLAARQVGLPLAPEVLRGLWQWSRRSMEA